MALQDTLEPIFDPEMQAIWEQFEAGERQGVLDGQRTQPPPPRPWNLSGNLPLGTLVAQA